MMNQPSLEAGKLYQWNRILDLASLVIELRRYHDTLVIAWLPQASDSSCMDWECPYVAPSPKAGNLYSLCSPLKFSHTAFETCSERQVCIALENCCKSSFQSYKCKLLLNLHGSYSLKNSLYMPVPNLPTQGAFSKLGVPFWGPYNKDYSILGSILGCPNFGKLPQGFSIWPRLPPQLCNGARWWPSSWTGGWANYSDLPGPQRKWCFMWGSFCQRTLLEVFELLYVDFP